MDFKIEKKEITVIQRNFVSGDLEIDFETIFSIVERLINYDSTFDHWNDVFKNKKLIKFLETNEIARINIFNNKLINLKNCNSFYESLKDELFNTLK